MQKSITIGIASSIVLFFIGYVTFSSFFSWTLPVVRNVRYVNTTLNFHFIHSLAFSIALSLIPMAIVLTWRFANIISVEKRLYSSLLIIAFIILAGLIRYWMIRVMALKTGEPGYQYEYGIPLYKVNIEIYMIIGLIAGVIIAYLLFHRRKEEIPMFSFEAGIKELAIGENEN